MQIACLVDTTRCIGCRSCQVACKQAHGLKAEKTRFFAHPGGYQNPARQSADTRTFIAFHERDERQGPVWIFMKQQCLHCTELRCGAVCPPQIFRRTESGVVAYEGERCLGCSACVDACPVAAVAIDYWDQTTPRVQKCDFCLDRLESPAEAIEVNGLALAGPARQRAERAARTPCCVQACPSGALEFGSRPALLAEAHRRIAATPGRYLDHVYGEFELGGTSWLYLASIPFDDLGLPTRLPPFNPAQSMMGESRPAAGPRLLGAASLGLAMMGQFFQRRERLARENR